MTDRIRLFVGTSRVNQVEEAVLLHTARAHVSAAMDVYRLRGDEEAVEGPGGCRRVQIPPELHERHVTKFTAMRFAVPELCGFEGIAVYVDSDQLLLDDLAALRASLRPDDAFAAVAATDAVSSYRFRRLVLEPVLGRGNEPPRFLASVLVFDCSRCRFTMKDIAEALAARQFEYEDLIWLGPGFRSRFGLSSTKLDPRWNSLDVWEAKTAIVHFTDLSMQPWRFANHPLRDAWRRCFVDALRSGALTERALVEQYRGGRLSWSTLRLGMSTLRGNPVGPVPGMIMRAYDRLQSTIVDLLSEVRFRIALLRRSLRVGA